MDVPLCSLLRSHPGLVEEDRKNEFMFGLVMEAIPELGARDFLRRRIEAFGMIYSEKKGTEDMESVNTRLFSILLLAWEIHTHSCFFHSESHQ
jgi:hypothetical protein